MPNLSNWFIMRLNNDPRRIWMYDRWFGGWVLFQLSYCSSWYFEGPTQVTINRFSESCFFSSLIFCLENMLLVFLHLLLAHGIFLVSLVGEHLEKPKEFVPFDHMRIRKKVRISAIAIRCFCSSFLTLGNICAVLVEGVQYLGWIPTPTVLWKIFSTVEGCY